MSWPPGPRDAPVSVGHGSLAAWSVAARPRSLPLALSPVLVGAALGYARSGVLDLQSALLVLAACNRELLQRSRHQ